MKKQKFYAVLEGKKTGIYNSWDECKAQVIGFKGAIYKSFENLEEAENFICIGRENNEKIENKEDMSIFDAVFYVDGSYNIKTKEFSYGVVLLKNDAEEHFNKKFDDKELATMRNVAGEIMGSWFALEYAMKNGYKNIAIYFDYEGIEKWALGLWKANKDGTIAYKKYYDSIKNDLNVKFVKVKGHSGDKYNDVADKLAKEAIGIKS